jgi:hypothetical protein
VAVKLAHQRREEGTGAEGEAEAEADVTSPSDASEPSSASASASAADNVREAEGEGRGPPPEFARVLVTEDTLIDILGPVKVSRSPPCVCPCARASSTCLSCKKTAPAGLLSHSATQPRLRPPCPLQFESEAAARTSVAGVSTGLAWKPSGGELLFIECSTVPSGRGQLTITGKLGEVMKESAQIATTWLRSKVGSRAAPPVCTPHSITLSARASMQCPHASATSPPSTPPHPTNLALQASPLHLPPLPNKPHADHRGAHDRGPDPDLAEPAHGRAHPRACWGDPQGRALGWGGNRGGASVPRDRPQGQEQRRHDGRDHAEGTPVCVEEEEEEEAEALGRRACVRACVRACMHLL